MLTRRGKCTCLISPHLLATCARSPTGSTAQLLVVPMVATTKQGMSPAATSADMAAWEGRRVGRQSDTVTPYASTADPVVSLKHGQTDACSGEAAPAMLFYPTSNFHLTIKKHEALLIVPRSNKAAHSRTSAVPFSLPPGLPPHPPASPPASAPTRPPAAWAAAARGGGRCPPPCTPCARRSGPIGGEQGRGSLSLLRLPLAVKCIQEWA